MAAPQRGSWSNVRRRRRHAQLTRESRGELFLRTFLRLDEKRALLKNIYRYSSALIFTERSK